MSLSRSLSRILSPSNPKRWSLLQPSSFSTKTLASSPANRGYKKKPQPSTSDLPKPSEIPFQPQVANSVHLVGSIRVPVQLQILSNGVFAVSVLVQETSNKDSPNLCIPVIFQGDLAQIAAFHLKERDLVYVTGQLTGDILPQTGEDNSQKPVQDARNHLQVLANGLNFVQKTCSKKESETVYGQDTTTSLAKKDTTTSDCTAEVEENSSNLNLWSDLFDNPHDWWDNRSSKRDPARAAFKHKKSGQQLWINDSTPEWVLSKLDKLSFGRQPSSENEIQAWGGADKLNNSIDSLWSDLVDNPQQWLDNRRDKLEGLVKPNFPDFKQKDTKKVLWLNTAPSWVLAVLDGLVLCASKDTKRKPKGESLEQPCGKSKQVSGQSLQQENLWRNLVENPSKWWDNRSNKLNPKSPDFKHKDTGEALWLRSSTPPWVLEKLPNVSAKHKTTRQNIWQKADTLLA